MSNYILTNKSFTVERKGIINFVVCNENGDTLKISKNDKIICIQKDGNTIIGCVFGVLDYKNMIILIDNHILVSIKDCVYIEIA